MLEGNLGGVESRHARSACQDYREIDLTDKELRNRRTLR